MNPSDQQAQGLYRLCYRLTNAIYPQWQYRNIVRSPNLVGWVEERNPTSSP